MKARPRRPRPATDRPRRRPGLRGYAQRKGVSVANTASISANIAGRYAQAVFDLAREQGALDGLGREVALPDGSPEALARGLGSALEQVLTELDAHLRALELTSP